MADQVINELINVVFIKIVLFYVSVDCSVLVSVQGNRDLLYWKTWEIHDYHCFLDISKLIDLFVSTG